MSCAPYGNPQVGVSPTAVYSRADGLVIGWGKYLVFGDSGWVKLRDASWCPNPQINDQCVHVNLSNRALEGWGWSAGTVAGVDTGVGWVQFQGQINVPWLETRYGTVYGRKNVGSSSTSAAPTGFFNSSYCILATGNIVNLTSQDPTCSVAGYNDLSFPNASQKYRTLAGVIDFKKILDGNEQNIAAPANLPQILDGKVYHLSGQASYTISNPLTFFNARNLNSSGAGTVVVDGDLNINSNLYYENSKVTAQIENLASIAWIVKGDLIIDPAVTNLVGNFIVLGKAGAICPGAGCGNFKTGNDSANPTQLVIKGMAMARQFTFERNYKKDASGAEQIIYDGRVLVNIPPGLEDVAKGLPIWREDYPNTQIQ